MQPSQAVQTLNDRVKRINKINLEIADWLQERRRVEEQYALGLRKLAQFKTPNSLSELGVFQAPWLRIVDGVERVSQHHHLFAERIENDVERPLRSYQQRSDYQNMHQISTNLGSMAKDLEDAQEKSDKLNKKANKASTQKIDAAAAKLESASQQWESQSPFIFETLQALDETRINQLRDQLTQYQTHEADLAQRSQLNTAETLAVLLEVSTEKEIQDFSRRITAVRTRTSTRRMSIPRPPTSSSLPPLPTSGVNSNPLPAPPENASSQPPAEDDAVDQVSMPPPEGKPESKLRRLGTMLGGRKRQSVQFGHMSSPQKGGGTTFGRLGSSHGRVVSPRASSTNLHQDSAHLTSLAESPDQPRPDGVPVHGSNSFEATNGISGNGKVADRSVAGTAVVNGTHRLDVADSAPQQGEASAARDAAGFTVRAPMNDPITNAQREAAAEEADQLFKLNIKNEPVEDEDPQAKQAALSNVANTLKMGPATQRSGTIRGRRDVRNTIYVPAPTAATSTLSESQSDGAGPSTTGSPPMSTSSFSRPPAVMALASEASVAGTSDSQSVRSGNSLGSLAHANHPDMTSPGLNCSIIETVSATFDKGEIKTVSIAGEIAFVNNATNLKDTRETIRINQFPRLERIGPNRIFVQNASPDQPDQFTLDVAHIAKTSIAFSYRVFAQEAETPALAQHAPLLLIPAWKPQGDKLGLLLQYQLNPSSNFGPSVTLHNVVFIATYSGRAAGVQTKPSGTHLKEKHLIYWRLGDVTLTGDVQKIVCRVTGAEGNCPAPGHVEARWEYAASRNEAIGSGISVSRLYEPGAEFDPFSDHDRPVVGEKKWLDVPVQRKLASGKYEAK
ncbi:hypothetical protein RJ55_04019 [Drechmeria coniospora]|nr:hypothetical protein RJ55_04019 [Drechmeria coniospora]